MSRREDVIMQVRDRMREMSREDYAYYMSRRGCSGGGGGYGRESETRGRSRSGSESVVDERGDYVWEFGGGGASGRVRSRSPQRYREVSRRGDVLDVRLGCSRRRKSTTPPFQPRETYEPASQMISPGFIDVCKYVDPTLEAGMNEYVTVHRNKMGGSDDIDVVHEYAGVSRMVRPHQSVQPVSSYGETSRHFCSGSANDIVDKRDRHGKYLSTESALNLGTYNEDSHPLYSRGTLYPVPVCSKSQANIYASTSPNARGTFRISSLCQGNSHIKTDALCGKRSVISKRSVIDANEGHLAHYSALDHHNARSSINHLKSTYDSIQRLNYHYPSVREGQNGELGYLSDREYSNVHAGFSQTHMQRAPGIGREANVALSDEEFEAICENAKKDCYNARHVSHDRDIHSDPHSCLSHPHSLLHGGMDHDYKDPHFTSLSEYDYGFMAAETCIGNYHNQEGKTKYTNSRANFLYNAEGTHGDLSESRLWSSPVHCKQDEHRFYASRIVSSTEPRDKHVDSGIFYPDICSEIKQYGDHFDLPPPEKEQRGRCRYRDSQKDSISSKFDSAYDVNTSEYDMVMGRLVTNKQRWMEDDPTFHCAPSSMLESNPVTYNISAVLNSGSGIRHRRCNPSAHRYLPDMSEDEMSIHLPETIGVNHNSQTGSRSIFDRLGSPWGPIDQIPRSRMQGHSISHRHELRHSKDRTKPNHITSKGFPHSSRGSSCYKQSNSSNTNTEEGHMSQTEDIDTLKDVDLHFDPSSQDNNGDFNQSIQKAFLLISLKINENPATRMRYKGQGKVGTLFCIVCKRSNSKEFRIARDLAAHSLTCQKPGLRAQHLGLFKAICVTMGWNSDIDQQTGMWAPEILPEEKALAQKEDLICWPPVFIIHNVSLMRKNHNTHRVLTAEELETFFRSKGFISGGVKVCLGQSTNCHIMVIKFLGTFTGLKDAEKLHNYFAESKHGRVEFWKWAYTDVKVSQPCEGLHNDSAEMPDLYGYMGIAEDWGRLDTESKKRCTIKSKQDILDFSAGPSFT